MYSDDIYIIESLPKNLVEEISARIPVISNGRMTVVFIDDFADLEEDLQESILEYL